MFMIDDDNLEEHIENKDFMFIPYNNQHLNFAWNALFLINKNCPDKDQINWWCGMVDGIPVDVGGYTSQYLKKHLDLKIGLIHSQYIQDDPSLDFHPSDYEFIKLTENSNKSILHYRSGSNWNNRTREYHQQKTAWLKNQIGLE